MKSVFHLSRSRFLYHNSTRPLRGCLPGQKGRSRRPTCALQKLPSVQSSGASLKTLAEILGIEKRASVTWDEIILVIHNFIISMSSDGKKKFAVSQIFILTPIISNIT